MPQTIRFVPVLAMTLVAPAVALAGERLPHLPYRACAETVAEGTFGCNNVANLRRQVAQPADLVQGRPMTPTMGALDAAALERLRTGRTKPLLNSSTSSSFPTSNSGSSGGSSGASQ